MSDDRPDRLRLIGLAQLIIDVASVDRQPAGRAERLAVSLETCRTRSYSTRPEDNVLR
jgi:hypothetical protein